MKKIVSLAVTAFLSLPLASPAATPDLPSCDSWYPAASCNYEVSNRPSSFPISYVVIHKVQGSAASAVSWFQNCQANASTHYTFNNTSGYCYQSVYEKDIAWHGANYWYAQRSVGIEHGGFDNSNDTATVCYDESALETKSCCIYYGTPYSRSNIIGHQEIPGCPTPGYGGQSCSGDPGPYWNWTYYFAKCNPNPLVPLNYIVDNANAGFSASANWATGTSAADKYGTNYRFRSAASGTSDAATFTANVAQAGKFNVYAWWPQGANRSSSVPHVITTSGGNLTVNVNQQINGGAFRLLASPNLNSGTNTIKVSVWTSAAGVCMADAVKWYGPYQ
jgi:N-acetylmuramoyl-L-alanine amidase